MRSFRRVSNAIVAKCLRFSGIYVISLFLSLFVSLFPVCFAVFLKNKKIGKGQKPELMCLLRKRTPVAKFLQFFWHLLYSVVFVADCFSVPCLFYGVCEKKKNELRAKPRTNVFIA